MGALHTLRGTVARIAPLIGQDSANGDWNNVSKVSPGHRRGLAARNDRVSIRADAGLPAIPLQLRLQRIYPGLSAHCHFWIRRRPWSLLRTGLLQLCSCLCRPRLQWLERSRLEPLVSRNPTFIFDATAAPRARLLYLSARRAPSNRQQ